MTKLLLSFAALTFLAACDAGTPPAGSATPAGAAATDAAKADSSGHFVLRSQGGSGVEVLIADGNITGPSVSVTRYQTASDHALRGTAFGSPVDVAIAGSKANGMVGSGPLDLSTERRQGKIHISGLVGGLTTDFEVNMKVLHGKIGQCNYDLTWNGKAYEGTQGCGSSAGAVMVSVPTTLGKWSDPELGACLSILMGKPPSEQFAATGMRTLTNQPPDPAGAHSTVDRGKSN